MLRGQASYPRGHERSLNLPVGVSVLQKARLRKQYPLVAWEVGPRSSAELQEAAVHWEAAGHEVLAEEEAVDNWSRGSSRGRVGVVNSLFHDSKVDPDSSHDLPC